MYRHALSPQHNKTDAVAAHLCTLFAGKTQVSLALQSSNKLKNTFGKNMCVRAFGFAL